MAYSEYTKKRIIYHYEGRLGVRETTRVLRQEGPKVSKSGVCSLIKRFKERGNIAGSGRPSLIAPDIQSNIDNAMEKDDETTALELLKILKEHCKSMSIKTILCCRKQLGWTYRGAAYCQLIRQSNKIKRLAWAPEYSSEATCTSGFSNLIFTDETSVQLESHPRFSHHRKGQPPRP